MDNEIGTYSMILSKTQLGKSGSECPTKTTILAIHELIAVDNASTYGSSECVRIRDVRRKTVEWNYYLSVTPTSISTDAGKSMHTIRITSYKKRVVDGVEESAQTAVSWDYDWNANWISPSGGPTSTSVSFYTNENTTTSTRRDNVIITQAESGKTATVSVVQDAGDVSDNYYLEVDPTSMSFGASGGTKSYTVSSYKKQVVNGVEQSGSTDVGWSANVTGSGFSYTSTDVTASSNSGSARTGTLKITQDESKYWEEISLSQDAQAISYAFSVSDWQKSVGAAGGTTDAITVTSTKTENGSTTNIGWSIDSSTVPSWVTWNASSMTFTVAANTGTSGREQRIYFQQNESGNRDYAQVSQAGSAPTPDTYVFTWSDNTTDNKTDNVVNTASTKSYDVKSTKNGSAQGWTAVSDATSWLTVTKTATAITYSVTANTGTAARTGNITLTQDGSGKTLKIVVSQRGTQVVEEWRYRFANGQVIGRDITSWSIARLNDEVGVFGHTNSIWSYKSKYINGVEDISTREYVSFTASVADNWIHSITSTLDQGVLGIVEWNYQANPAQTDRTTKMTLTQSGSSKTCTIDILQVGWGSFVGTYTLDASSKNIEVGKEGIAMGLDITSKFTVAVPEQNYSSYYYITSKTSTIYSVKLIHGSNVSDWARIQIPQTTDSTGLWKSRFIIDANPTASSRRTVLSYVQSEILSVEGVRKYGSKANEMQMGHLAIEQQAGDYVPETNVWITVNNPQRVNVYPFSDKIDFVEALSPSEFRPAVDWGSDGTIRHFYTVSEGIDVCDDYNGAQGKAKNGDGIQFYTTEPFGSGSAYIRLVSIGSLTLNGQDQTVTVG